MFLCNGSALASEHAFRLSSKFLLYLSVCCFFYPTFQYKRVLLFVVCSSFLVHIRAVLCISYKSRLRIDACHRGAVAFEIDVIQ